MNHLDVDTMIARGELTTSRPPWTGRVVVATEVVIELDADEELPDEAAARDRAVEILRQALKDASSGQCPRYASTREILSNRGDIVAVAVEPY